MNAGPGVLLDTHAFLWWSSGDPRLGAEARQAILVAPSVYVSIATAWEMAIKSSVGKLRVDVPYRHAVRINRFESLQITLDHVERVAALPRHHGDPFDRMLAAQALHEGLTLVTHDRAFAPYALPLLWA